MGLGFGGVKLRGATNRPVYGLGDYFCTVLKEDEIDRIAYP
jgi:hypothetical protein